MPISQSYSFSSTQQSALSSSEREQNPITDISLRRVTIRQLLRATPTGASSKGFQIDGVDLKKVMLVANVRDERETSGGKSYDFDDGTGRIRGNGWKLNTDFTFQQFAYARVVGELDQFKGLYSLKLIDVQPIFDAYEIYFHILSAMGETLMLERGLPPPEFLSVDQINHTASESNQNIVTLSQALSSVSISTKNTQPRSKLQRDIISIVLDNTDDDDDAEGVLIDLIVAKLRPLHHNLGSHDTVAAIEFLLENDYITSNDDHLYKPGPRYRNRK